MAHEWPVEIETVSERIEAKAGTTVVGWVFSSGAGDGNRTRTVSLGI
jgi:hypothetical protein